MTKPILSKAKIKRLFDREDFVTEYETDSPSMTYYFGSNPEIEMVPGKKVYVIRRHDGIFLVIISRKCIAMNALAAQKYLESFRDPFGRLCTLDEKEIAEWKDSLEYIQHHLKKDVAS